MSVRVQNQMAINSRTEQLTVPSPQPLEYTHTHSETSRKLAVNFCWDESFYFQTLIIDDLLGNVEMATTQTHNDRHTKVNSTSSYTHT